MSFTSCCSDQAYGQRSPITPKAPPVTACFRRLHDVALPFSLLVASQTAALRA